MTKSIYSVGQVNHYIRNMFAQDFLLHHISVKGEVSNCKYHSSGHIYFTIKDEQGTMSAVMFAGNRKGLRFHMKEGDRVIVTGSIEVYERDGKYQLYAREIELDGSGNLYLKFEALKRELEEMGMFDSQYKQDIPPYIQKLGVVTAPTGAAIQDIRNISYRRNPGIQLILYPALVQGDGAAESIVNGIRALEQLGVDTIIVGRGGGSIEDLWAFNEEIVARAIFECRIPIISAVGHETDWTIADFVADMRAPTPSAAAELAVFDRNQTLELLSGFSSRIHHNMEKQLQLAKQKLAHYQNSLRYLSPESQLNEKRHRVLEYEEKISDRMERILREKRQTLMLFSGKLEGYSPMKKLSMGYAYVEDSAGNTLLHAKAVKPEDTITVHLADGIVKAQVSEVLINE